MAHSRIFRKFRKNISDGPSSGSKKHSEENNFAFSMFFEIGPHFSKNFEKNRSKIQVKNIEKFENNFFSKCLMDTNEELSEMFLKYAGISHLIEHPMYNHV